MLMPVRAHHSKDCLGSGDVGNYFVNYCEEKCVCEEFAPGQYDHTCYREREEFTCMPTSRRTRFLDAYKAVTTPGHPQYHQMKELIQKHGDGFWNGIHDTQFFLPWHRWYIMALENILRNEDCRVTVPWWRWSKKSTTWHTGTPFHPSTTWLGGDGAAGQCVVDGAFASWAPPLETCLKRSFQTSVSLPTGGQITAVLNLPDTGFGLFSDQLEGAIHNGPHMRIGGHMASLLSPRAPEFFLHHAYIDQLWDRWQRKSANHLASYDSYSPLAQLPYTYGNTPSTVQDHFDLKQSGVIYVNYKSRPVGPGHYNKFLPSCLWLVVSHTKHLVVDLQSVVDGLDEMGPESLRQIPQRGFRVPPVSDFEWWLDSANQSQQEKLRGEIAMMQKAAVSYNRKLEKPTEEFENEASQMLGYDLEKVMEVAGICPLGMKWQARERRCAADINQRALRRHVERELEESVVIGGEVVGKKQPRGGGRRLSPLEEGPVNLV